MSCPGCLVVAELLLVNHCVPVVFLREQRCHPSCKLYHSEPQTFVAESALVLTKFRKGGDGISSMMKVVNKEDAGATGICQKPEL